jgi:hypothetical protein
LVKVGACALDDFHVIDLSDLLRPDCDQVDAFEVTATVWMGPDLGAVVGVASTAPWSLITPKTAPILCSRSVGRVRWLAGTAT